MSLTHATLQPVRSPLEYNLAQICRAALRSCHWTAPRRPCPRNRMTHRTVFAPGGSGRSHLRREAHIHPPRRARASAPLVALVLPHEKPAPHLPPQATRLGTNHHAGQEPAPFPRPTRHCGCLHDEISKMVEMSSALGSTSLRGWLTPRCIQPWRGFHRLFSRCWHRLFAPPGRLPQPTSYTTLMT